jgi:serine protease Do
MSLSFALRSIIAATLGALEATVASCCTRIYPGAGARLNRWLSDMALLFRPSARLGALISHIGTGSPAEDAGLEAGDVILRFGGRRVKNTAQLQQCVAAVKPGTDTKVDVVRNGRSKSFIVTIR